MELWRLKSGLVAVSDLAICTGDLAPVRKRKLEGSSRLIGSKTIAPLKQSSCIQKPFLLNSGN